MNDFEFDYYDEKDLKNLLSPGEVDFKITGYVLGESKSSGNKMVTLTIELRDDSGKTTLVNEYLVASKDDNGKRMLAEKIMRISKSINKPQLYAEGHKLRENDLLGERGRCSIIIEDGQGKYPDKNKIKKYIAADKVKVPEPVVDFIDDDLPF